ncbi:unnamed protein product [Cylicocyclus nassatus]|uniref:Alpha-mannosidase n=1 Tax=Cylicocyclus nassatus TaxID=53992 RepID=A0AA36HGE6_CYLNA|nr:unnamed protein product [Cylicocyclus nassatus]
MYLRYGRRKGRTALIIIVGITILTVYAIGYKSGASSLRRYDNESNESIDTMDIFVREEMVATVGVEACKPSPHNNGAAEFDMFNVYREQVAQQGAIPFKSDQSKRHPSVDKLKVFVLPFTHVDPGWLQTFDSYSKDTDATLDNMHNFMTSHPNMTFMWAELAFFERWWRKQSLEVRENVRRLVQSGRLEIASGSWVMTDEANVYYPITVDNIVEGHQFLKEELGGVTPSVVWSNDPFGYSNSIPYIFTQAGLKRAVINRIHHGIKRYLQSQRAIPFRWRQYFDMRGESDMLTHVLPYSHYDILNSCGPNPSICCEFDFKRLTHWSCPGPKPKAIDASNVAIQAQKLLSQLREMAQLYESNVLLMVHGDDFRYNMIQEWHQQHDNFLPLFEEINKGNIAEIRFGTFSDYFKELEKWYKENGKKPATLSGDFFPYKCALGDIWSGYFTTRPFVKRQERALHNVVRAADLITAQAWHRMDELSRTEVTSKLQAARRILSLLQHHDAITGTSRKHVMQDYSLLLHNATGLARSAFEVSSVVLSGGKVHTLEYSTSNSETESLEVLKVEELGRIVVNAYNSLPYDIEDVVSLRVDTANVAVSTDAGEVKAQIEPYIHQGAVSKDSFLLAFRCRFRALSTSSFILSKSDSPKLTNIASVLVHEDVKELLLFPSTFKPEPITSQDFFLENEELKTSHDNETGQLSHITTAAVGRTAVSTQFYKYENAFGGAYLMRVRDPPTPLASGSSSRFISKGPIQESAHLFFTSIYQRMIVKNVRGSLSKQVHFSLRVDITETKNTELLLRLETNLRGERFYTDSAGMQLLRRQRHEKLGDAANFYPMPSAAILECNLKRITVVSNLPHGVSPQPAIHGMDIVLDRMLNQDDGKGLGTGPDALPTDILPVEMRFSILMEGIIETATDVYNTYHTPAGHVAIQNVLYPPVLTTSSEKIVPLQAQAALPCNLQLLTNRVVLKGQLLLTVFNGGIICRTNTITTCSGQLRQGLTSYLHALGVVKVQETDLVGTPKTEEMLLKSYEPHIPPYKFLSLLLSFS